jgi:hypothetical protein
MAAWRGAARVCALRTTLLALCLCLSAAAHAAEPASAPRFQVRASSVRIVPPVATSRFALSARLLGPTPALEPQARFKAAAQLKVTTASCGAAGAIFRDGFEGP